MLFELPLLYRSALKKRTSRKLMRLLKRGCSKAAEDKSIPLLGPDHRKNIVKGDEG
ncbi:MAG: hypothetical protein ACTSW4_06100 [Candidatus Ranarchaeia archaeon]